MDLPVLDQARQYAAVLGLARNPAVSLPVLRKLMHVPGVAHRIARRPRIRDKLAEALLEAAEQLPDPTLVFLLDHDDRVSPRMRRRLAPAHLSPKLREACAENVHSTLRGSSVSFHRLEWLAGSTGPAAWTKLATHPDWQVRKALATAWKDAPEDIRRSLLADPEPEVRAAACRAPLPPAPADLHPQLISDPATRAAVAEYVALTPELAEELATDSDVNVRIGVANNTRLPASVRNELALSHDRSVLRNLILNEATPEPLRAQLYADFGKLPGFGKLQVSALRLRGAPWFCRLPLEQALTYLDSPCDFLRCELAQRNDLPAEAIARLDDDADVVVRQINALRPGAPGDVLERVVRDSQPHYLHWPRLIRHSNFPPEAFVRFASAPEATLRVTACYGEQLPADLVAKLARDADAEVRCAAAGHPKLSANDAVRLLGDEDGGVVEAATTSPALPLVAIDHIVGNLAVLEGYVTRGQAARETPSHHGPSQPGFKPAITTPKARETPETKMPVFDRYRLDAAITGLARNPAVSVGVLLRLMQYAPGEVRHAVGNGYRRGSIPDELVEALIEMYPDEIHRLESDERVSSAMRERLAKDDRPLRREAERESIGFLVSRGTVPLPLERLEKLVDSKGPAAWTELAAHPDCQVRRALAWAWQEAPEDIRRALLTDTEPEVRAAACWWPTPPDLYPQLLDDPATRAPAARHVALIPELAAELASDEDSQVWLGLAENPSLPASVRDSLATRNEPYVLRNLILNQTTPEPLRAQLYEQLARAVDDRSAHILNQASQWFWKLPLEKALTYLDSPHALIRRELAARKDLPAEAAARLDRDPDLEVRTWVAGRPDTPGDLLEQIVRDIVTTDPWNPPRMHLTAHSNFPRAAFARFASAPEAGLRAVACRDPNLPSDVVSRLAHDRDESVQRAAAGHRNLPADDAVWLLGLENTLLVEAAAASPALPPAAIDHILAYAARGR